VVNDIASANRVGVTLVDGCQIDIDRHAAFADHLRIDSWLQNATLRAWDSP
jgi:hypothetical protein